MKKIKNIRLSIQIIVLFVVIISAFNHYLSSIGKSIPWISQSFFHYICPICGVTSIYQFFASSTLWVVKLKSTLGIVIGLVTMITIIFGPVICGFICPFGTLQDLFARLGKKLNKTKYNKFIPYKVDKKLRLFRYLTLIGTIFLTYTSSVSLLESINPYHAFLGIFKQNVSIAGLIILIVVIVSSMFIQRPWCKYLCPYGALLGLSNKIKVFRVVRNKYTCISCKRCSNSCPINIDISSEEEIRDLGCISCFECVEPKVCPKSNTLFATSKDEITNKESEESLNEK